ncbi:hypothetical protein L1987_86658 [Smallanthus sonchifolius]|uniref:Uncharacterized protein n=1 Tax=Smallanthus sonchifolius TaxID=185202 RepID=A0ACB8XZW3_9ASTR|nr:hypothetical protein L1987_86658 [Smallanthus sonchifolius]
MCEFDKKYGNECQCVVGSNFGCLELLSTLHWRDAKFPDLQRGFFIIQTPAAKRKFQISKTQKYQVEVLCLLLKVAGTKICFVCTREQRVNLIKRKHVIASKVNTHLTPRPVLLTRHRESRDNVRGRIGDDTVLRKAIPL